MAVQLGDLDRTRVRDADPLRRAAPDGGVDSYLDGHRRMLGKLLRVVTIADGKGEEFDIGELSTYLNDAVLIAPSFLLRPNVTWAEVDNDTFDVTLADAGHVVTGRVFLDGAAPPVDFATTGRFVALPGGPRRAEWHTPVSGWTAIGARMCPGPVSAVWHLPDGQLPYIEG